MEIECLIEVQKQIRKVANRMVQLVPDKVQILLASGVVRNDYFFWVVIPSEKDFLR